MMSSIRVLAVLAFVFLASEAFGHARLKASAGVAPRSTNAGIKVGPCGNIPRGATAPQLTGGQKLLVTWEETIEHPGRYEIYFSQAGDANFVLLATVPDVQGGALPHQYNTEVTIPDVNCTDCTLQMIQVMAEDPDNPSFYYSCADMSVTSTTNPPPPAPADCD